MRRTKKVVVKSALAAVFLVAQMITVGAYTVCDDCGCHINHEGCYWYEHNDICHPVGGACYLSLNYGPCGGSGDLE